MIRKIINLLSFPGVVFHEFGHQIFCILTRTKVFKVKYFSFGNSVGFVEHEEPRGFFSSLFITTGPLTIGTILSIYFFILSKNILIQNQILGIFFIWLGFSIAINCLPSRQDARNLFHTTNQKLFKNPLSIIGYPISLILVILEWLRILYLDLVYAGFLYYISVNIIYGYVIKYINLN